MYDSDTRHITKLCSYIHTYIHTSYITEVSQPIALQATPSCVCHGVCQCQSVQIDGVCRTVKLSISMVITREIYNIHHNIDGPSPNLAT